MKRKEMFWTGTLAVLVPVAGTNGQPYEAGAAFTCQAPLVADAGVSEARDEFAFSPPDKPMAPAVPAATGVCCLCDSWGTCMDSSKAGVDVDQEYCDTILHGRSFHVGATCASGAPPQAPCVVPPTGACCDQVVATCTDNTKDCECDDPDQHIFQGQGTTCTADPCDDPIGACCSMFPAAGTCTDDVSKYDCQGEGEHWQGYKSKCTPVNPCSGRPLGTAFTFQAQLKKLGTAVTGTCDLKFYLYDVETLGTPIAETATYEQIVVDAGLFTVDVDFGVDAQGRSPLYGGASWLEVEVCCPQAGVPEHCANPPTNWDTLNRVKIMPTAYALALDGLWTMQTQSSPNLIGGYHGNEAAAGIVGATISGGGYVGAINKVSSSYATVSGGSGNTATGTAASIGGGRKNSVSAADATIAGGNQNKAYDDDCAIGGGFRNIAGSKDGVTWSDAGATVGGGSSNEATNSNATVGGGRYNKARANGATISGGKFNNVYDENGTIGGGAANKAGSERTDFDADYATVGGGRQNSAVSLYATIGGGYFNHAGDAIIGGEYGTVGGGYHNIVGPWSCGTIGGGCDNFAFASYSTVSGGHNNIAGAQYSAVPGGRENHARGHYSFAAGRRAKVRSSEQTDDLDGDEGTFLWADANDCDFTSTAANEFAARATGGVRFVTAIIECIPLITVYLDPGGTSWNWTSDRAIKENFATVDRQAILEKVAALPVQEYNLKSQDPFIRHIGPVAQDFAIFGYGGSETSINSQDASGVALAAIQGLYDIVQEKECEIKELRAEKDAQFSALERRNDELEARLMALEKLIKRADADGKGRFP